MSNIESKVWFLLLVFRIFSCFQMKNHCKTFKIIKKFEMCQKRVLQPAFGCAQYPKLVKIHNKLLFIEKNYISVLLHPILTQLITYDSISIIHHTFAKDLNKHGKSEQPKFKLNTSKNKGDKDDSIKTSSLFISHIN